MPSSHAGEAWLFYARQHRQRHPVPGGQIGQGGERIHLGVRKPGGEAGDETHTQPKGRIMRVTLHLLRLPEPVYRVIGEVGPDHAKTFIVELSIEGGMTARAEGRTKKEAQQCAARMALELLNSVTEGSE